MKTRRQLLLLAAIALLLAVAAIAIWKLTPIASAPLDKPPPAQIYDYVPTGSAPTGVPLRPMDTEIFEAVAKDHFSTPQLLDLFPDRPYHVKLVRDSIRNWIIAVNIDLERDGRWDERWEMRTDGCTRHVLPARFGNESPSFRLTAGRWVGF